MALPFPRKTFAAVPLLALAAFFALPTTGFAHSPCKAADLQAAVARKAPYTPSEAYAFGLLVTSMILNKDMKGLAELTNPAIENGPDPDRLSSSPYGAVFSDDWSQRLNDSEVPCNPVGYRGFMLGNGLVWYDKFDGKWSIVAYNDWKP